MKESPSEPGRARRGAAAAARAWALPVLTVVALNLAVTAFVGHESTLYSADHVAYWALSESLAGELRADPLAALDKVAESIAERELNLLPAVPIAAVMCLLGSSRVVWVLAVLDLYALPALLVLYLLAKRVAGADGAEQRVAGWCGLIAIALFPAYLYPVLLGYLGVGGVLLCGAAWLLYLRADAGEWSAASLCAIGVTLAALFLFRRWYGIWSLAFIVTIAVDAVAGVVRRRPTGAADLVRLLRPPALVGGSALGVLLLCALPRLQAALAVDYGDRFQAYKIHLTAWSELTAWVQHLGLVPVAAVAWAAVAGVRAPASRRPALLLLLHAAVSVILLRRIQDPSPQHWYLVLPGLMVLVMVLVMATAGRRRTAVVLGAAAALTAAWVVGAPSGVASGSMLPDFRLRPQQRHDLLEVRRLLASLDRNQAMAPGPIYVIGATPVLCDTALAFARLSLGTDYRCLASILASAHMDHRDGFPAALLVARYVVVSRPVQCRQPAVGQRVVELPATSILEATDIGRAFRRLPQVFHFDGGVEVYLYRRDRPFTGDELAGFSRRLREHYPDRPEIYSPPDL